MAKHLLPIDDKPAKALVECPSCRLEEASRSRAPVDCAVQLAALICWLQYEVMNVTAMLAKFAMAN